MDRGLISHDRTSPLMLWIGVICVTVGVALHLPMFLESAHMNYNMAGMSMDADMTAGMLLILGGTLLSGYGLLPRRRLAPIENVTPVVQTALAQPDLTITARHWGLMATIAVALIIDTMKPASLGFVVPGMLKEYSLTRSQVALLPFFALTGTTVGSVVWGLLADIFGRRAAILLAAILFIGTSICGAMPSFAWNLFMCFMMGLSAGGMLPIAFTLLSETMPPRHRGPLMVLVGGTGQLGGYVASSSCAAWLEPHFGWRIIWFIGLPTGILLFLLNRFIPESPAFLRARGLEKAAQTVESRLGAALTGPPSTASAETPTGRGGLILTSYSLNIIAVAWGLVNFGLILWLPTDLRAAGYTVQGSDTLLALTSVTALPTAVLTAWLYANWSSKGTIILLAAVMTVALFSLGASTLGMQLFGRSPMLLLTLLIIGTNGVIASLLPYSAECYPTRYRGRGTGLVAGSSKAGGIIAQIATMLQAVPGLGAATLVLAMPVAFGALLLGRYAPGWRELQR